MLCKGKVICSLFAGLAVWFLALAHDKASLRRLLPNIKDATSTISARGGKEEIIGTTAVTTGLLELKLKR